MTWGSLTEEEEPSFLHIPSLSACQSRARGEVFYPLMNWDCWSKVWIIEFLINYPELLSDKSAPLQPPSSSVVFYLIWSASCSPGPALRCPCLINADLAMETDAAVRLLVCVLMLVVGFVLCFGVILVYLNCVNILHQTTNLFFPPSSPVVTVIRSSTTWK